MPPPSPRRVLRAQVEPHFFAREEYKSAVNTFVETCMTGPQRENLTSLLSDLSDQASAWRGPLTI
jgi:hypothetical protein